LLILATKLAFIFVVPTFLVNVQVADFELNDKLVDTILPLSAFTLILLTPVILSPESTDTLKDAVHAPCFVF